MREAPSNSLIEIINDTAKKAGDIILTYYKLNDFRLEYKSDNSPVTIADRSANHFITSNLKEKTKWPVVSEEDPESHQMMPKFNRYWLIDPLDGTRDFIKKNGEFTVNIALIDNGCPILGVVFVPVNNDLYWAIQGKGAFKNNLRIKNDSRRQDLIGVASRSDLNTKTKAFFRDYNITNYQKLGSSLKFLKVAEGSADVYPRFTGSSEWDTAAAHIIAKEAGCKVISLESGKELTYSKNNSANPYFVVYRSDLVFMKPAVN